MKTLYALVLGLVLLPACCCKKKRSCESDASYNEHVYVEERISGVENALDLK